MKKEREREGKRTIEGKSSDDDCGQGRIQEYSIGSVKTF